MATSLMSLPVETHIQILEAGMELDDEDFDPIKYINSKFPDENSLANLDQEIELVKQEIERLDKEILEDIHEHAILNKKTKDELDTTHVLTSKLITEIKVA